MPEFYQTMMGQKFYQHDVPQLTKVLERIAKRLEAQPMPEAAEENEPEDIIAAILEAQKMGFEVREDVDQPGMYLFIDPNGEGSEISFESESAAWRQVIAEMEDYENDSEKVVEIEDKPLSKQELESYMDDEGYIRAVVQLDMSDMVASDLEALNDLVSTLITGTCVGLSDIDYRLVGHEADRGTTGLFRGILHVMVIGKVTDDID